jgi:hypothetical protein
MADQPTDVRIERLTTIKSAFIVEARSAKAQGLDTPAKALFLRAAEMELELAELFLARDEANNAQVSWRSAGFCFLEACQFRKAAEALRKAAERFPDVREALAECEGKDDVPLPMVIPGLQALIDLLVRKNVIEASEWADAMKGSSAS